LALSAGCDAFQHQVANALRSQIASDVPSSSFLPLFVNNNFKKKKKKKKKK